jgi:hypothetical protein
LIPPTDDAATDLLIREVNEDLRHDQMRVMWQRYGSLFIVAGVAVVLGVAAWQAWQKWDMRQRLASSDAFVATLSQVESGKREDALKQLSKLTIEGTPGYRLLAKLEQADILVNSGDINGAIEIYKAINSDSSIDQIYRDLAKLKSAYLSLDSSDPAVTDRQVESLAQEASPWRFEAREIQALDALKRGETTRAIELYKALTDDMVAPQGIRQRAAEMLKLLQPTSPSQNSTIPKANG